MMQLTQAIKIAQWLEETWKNYVIATGSGMDRVGYKGNLSGDWESGDKVRVSKLGGTCPKYNAAVALDIIEKPEFTFNEMYKFHTATRIAEGIYEAIEWGCKENRGLSFEAERRITEHWSGLAGTIDGVLMHDSGASFPIEVKRTDADKFKKNPRGISYYHFLQTIGEMVLLSNEENNYGKCDTGFVFTAYSPDSTNTHTAWIIRFNAEDEGWYLYKGLQRVVSNNSDFPTNEQGEVFLRVVRLKSMIEEYRKWMEIIPSFATNSLRPYGDMFNAWQCGRAVAPDYYKADGVYGNKGDLKPDTGIYTIKCPLFKYCYRKELFNAGYEVDKIEAGDKLRLQPNDYSGVELMPLALDTPKDN